MQQLSFRRTVEQGPLPSEGDEDDAQIRIALAERPRDLLVAAGDAKLAEDADLLLGDLQNRAGGKRAADLLGRVVVLPDVDVEKDLPVQSFPQEPLQRFLADLPPLGEGAEVEGVRREGRVFGKGNGVVRLVLYQLVAGASPP